MKTVDEIYSMIRGSEMNGWVGGGDPASVGESCYSILARHLDLNRQANILDFGCGVGRVSLAVLHHAAAIERFVGLDIVPSLVHFCRSIIGPSFPKASFDLVDASNDHYDRFKVEVETDRGQNRQDLQACYSSFFDYIYAFSVFTHMDIDDFVANIRLIRDLLKPDGTVLFTCFILNQYSRMAIERKMTRFAFDAPMLTPDKKVFYGTKDDKLAFVAYDQSMLDEMVRQADLVPMTTEFGNWRDGGPSNSLQDVVICRRGK